MRGITVPAALTAALLATALAAPDAPPAADTGASVVLDRLLDATGDEHAALRGVFVRMGAAALAEVERRLADEAMSPRDRALVVAIRECLKQPAAFEGAQRAWDATLSAVSKDDRADDLAMGLRFAESKDSAHLRAVWTIEALLGHAGERGDSEADLPSGERRDTAAAHRVQSAIAFGRTHEEHAAPGLAAIAEEPRLWWVAKHRAGQLLLEISPPWLPSWLVDHRPDVAAWLRESSPTRETVTLVARVAAMSDAPVANALVDWLVADPDRPAIPPKAMDEGARAATTVLRRFECEAPTMGHKSGHAVDGSWVVVPEEDRDGVHAVYGPYVTDLPDGKLLFARWRFRLEAPEGDAKDAQVVLDVTRNTGSYREARQTVRAADVVAGEWTTWTIPFRLHEAGDVEFRVEWTGRCRASFDCVEVLEPAASGSEPWSVARPERNRDARIAAARVLVDGLDDAVGPAYRARRNALLADRGAAFGPLTSAKASGPSSGVAIAASRLADADGWAACDAAFDRMWNGLVDSCPWFEGNVAESNQCTRAVADGSWTYTLPGEKAVGPDAARRLGISIGQGPELPASPLWLDFLREQVRLFSTVPASHPFPGALRFHALLHLAVAGDAAAIRDLKEIAAAKPRDGKDGAFDERVIGTARSVLEFIRAK